MGISLAHARPNRLPPLWRGPRRRYLMLLVVTGLSQALLAGVGGHTLRQTLLSSSHRSPSGQPGTPHHTHLYLALLVMLLALAAVAVGVLSMAERVLTERLSQHYVHEVRLGLVRRNLTQGLQGSLGVAVTRTSNDLTAVRNWISSGISPLVSGVPLIAGSAVALGLLNPAFVLALVAPLVVLLLALYTLAEPTFERTRALRKTRGRLSSQIADSMLATAAIRAGGGAVRELNKIERLSGEMVAAAIRTARWAGALRGAGAASSGLAVASTAAIGLMLNLPVASIAGALTLLGYLASPMSAFGSSAEFRQSYRAAVRMIGPVVQPAPEIEPEAAASNESPASSAADPSPEEETYGDVVALAMRALDGSILPMLVAEPGDRVVVDLGDRRETSHLLARFAGLETLDGSIEIAGKQLRGASHGRLRRLVGYGAQGLMLSRGTITNAVKYRATDTPDEVVKELIDLVGLKPRLKQLPKGAKTLLIHGGDPLTVQERALVQLARALLNTPPLLVFDHLDADLGLAGRETLSKLLVTYPGVVLIAGEHADEVVTPTHVWRRDAVVRPGRSGWPRPRHLRPATLR